MPSCRFAALLIGAIVAGAPGVAWAQLKAEPGDWPGWRGADRTGVSTETGLLREWPKEGPKLLWKTTGLGVGFSTPAVAKGHLYLIGSKGREEYVFCLDVAAGKKVWDAKIGPPGRTKGYDGTRSTPTVDGEFLYALGSDGDLVCLETAGGKPRWQKNLRRDFGGSFGAWAYAESPLIDGDTLVCTPGGSKAALVALNKKTGDVIWQTQLQGRSEAAYSSAIVAEVGNVRHYVQFLGDGVVAVAAKDGKLLWRYNRTSNGSTNCPTPIFHDDCVFTSTKGVRGGGAGLVKLTSSDQGVAAKELYFKGEFANHHGGIVRVGDHLYGTTERTLMCVDFKTGEEKWEERSVGKGSVTAADGHLYVRSELGPVALVEATPAGYKEKGRFSPPDRGRERAWAHPVIAGGRLYLRDGDVLQCYVIRAK